MERNGVDTSSSMKTGQKVGKREQETLSAALSNVTNRAVEYAEDVGAKAVERIKATSDEQLIQLTENVKKNPLSSVAIAAGVGLVFGLMWRRSS